jgi:hypothetical protein
LSENRLLRIFRTRRAEQENGENSIMMIFKIVMSTIYYKLKRMRIREAAPWMLWGGICPPSQIFEKSKEGWEEGERNIADINTRH